MPLPTGKRPKEGSHEAPDPSRLVAAAAVALAALGFTVAYTGGASAAPTAAAKKACVHGTALLERNKRNVVAYYTRAFNDKEPEDAVERYGGGADSTSSTTRWRGAELPAFIEFVRSFTTAFPDVHIDIRRVVAECDLVVTHGLLTGRGARLHRARQQGGRHLPARRAREDRRALGRPRGDLADLCERQPGGLNRGNERAGAPFPAGRSPATGEGCSLRAWPRTTRSPSRAEGSQG